MAGPRIVYCSWPAGEISGGIKVIFQHVQLLNEAGFTAAVATEDGGRPGWFDNTVPLLKLADVGPGDVLVFPENHEGFMARFETSAQPKLVFCQNPYYAWRGLAGRASYADFGVSRVLCVSHTVMQFFKRRMPAMPLAYTPFYIDHTLFSCPPTKTLQIACVPRKRPQEVMAIRDLFRAANPQFAQLPWLLIQNASEAAVAQAMRDSAVFLSLARLEAHGMTTLEAMASGCLVAGFTGIADGPSDTATAANGLWAPEDDVAAAAERLGLAARLAQEQGLVFQAMVANARQTAWAYRREECARQLVAAWRAILPGVVA